MKFAVIDIGSNTVKLEIYNYKNGDLKQIGKQIEKCGIASHKTQGALDNEGIVLLVSALSRFRSICSSEGVTDVFAFATQSLRNISNADEVCKTIRKETALEIDIIPGEDEARLGFEAFCERGYTDGHGILTDMGGGSTEITEFEGKNILSSVSLPFGSLYLKVVSGSGIMPDRKQEDTIFSVISDTVKKSGINVFAKDLYCCGGTASGVFKLFCSLNDKKVKTVSASELKEFYGFCKENPLKAEAAAQNLTPERADSVFTGFFAHICLMDIFGSAYVTRCTTTCRAGYAAELVKKGIIK